MGHCRIVFQANRDYHSVSVAGGFNGWNLSANPLSPSGRRWSVDLSLPVGRYPYKLVLDGKDWILDPGNPHKEDGGNVDFNSLVTVYPDGYEQPARIGDGRITASPLLHLQTPNFITVDQGKLVLSLRVRPNDIAQVEAVVNGKSYAMPRASQDDLFEIRRVQIPLPKGQIRYGFRLQDGAGSSNWYGPSGLSTGEKGSTYAIQSNGIPTINIPKWAPGAVLYEIFPDRFANGDKTNDPPGTLPWNAKPDFNRFFGGDAAGVEAHLDYLRQLGIQGVYFTPVFESPANHRYLTQDFLKVDHRFASQAQFQHLTQSLRSKGIRTILDGVFSCTGTDFFAFQDLLKNQERSKFKDWYVVNRYPVKTEGTPTYESWGGYGGLPLANLKNPEMRDYLLGVAPYWNQHATLAGWRLDSAERLSPEFCREFRKREKALDPQGWIVGEIWGDANQWLQGDMFDSVMGYQFRGAAVAFLAKDLIGPSEFLNRLMTTYTSYPPQVSRNLMNLVGSHDTPRFLSLCKGDKRLAALGAVFQLTWPGTPCVYYGDEVGMEGFADPDNRRGMRWDLANSKNELLSTYRNLIQARRANPVLQTGEPLPLLADDHAGVVAYARVLGSTAAIIAGNRSSKTATVAIRVPGKATHFTDVLSRVGYLAEGGSIRLQLQAKSAVVLLPR